MRPARARLAGALAVASLVAPALAARAGGAGTVRAQETTMKEAPKAEIPKPIVTAGPQTSLLPSPSSPLVTFRIQFRAGSADDPPGKEGLNALTALTIGEGGTKTLTFREVTDRLYPMAASIGAQPDREVTTFIGEVHRDHLKEFYGLLRDVLLAPRFDPADFARNRDLLLSQIETTLRSNDDERLGKEALNGMMYEGQPYGHPDVGTVRGLRAITLEDVQAYYRQRYRRGNVLLGLAGGFPGDLIETLKRDFGALPEGVPEVAPLPAPKRIEGMQILFVDKPAPATAISIGCPIDVTRADRDFYALMVAGSYLGEHRTFHGRLMNIMRADRGLNYGDYAYIENFIQEGGSTFPLPNIPRRQQHFSIWIRPVPPVNAPFALRQAVRELSRVVERGLTEEEFETTRRFLLNYSRLWTQSLSRRLGYQMDSRFYGTGFFIDRVQEELPRLKVEDVNAALKRHLNARDLDVVLVTGEAAAMRDLILSGAPTPIAYQAPTTREDLLKEDEEIEAYPLPIIKDRVRVVPARDLFER